MRITRYAGLALFLAAATLYAWHYVPRISDAEAVARFCAPGSELERPTKLGSITYPPSRLVRCGQYYSFTGGVMPADAGRKLFTEDETTVARCGDFRSPEMGEWFLCEIGCTEIANLCTPIR